MRDYWLEGLGWQSEENQVQAAIFKAQVVESAREEATKRIVSAVCGAVDQYRAEGK